MAADSQRFIVGGTLPADAAFYLEREADAQLLDHCLNSRFAYVLTSRQMGKSSLMARTAARLQQQGVLPVIVDLTSIGAQNVTAEQWYAGLLLQIDSYVSVDVDIEVWWREHAAVPPSQRFYRFLTDVLVPGSETPIVVFVDEIDSTLGLGFTDDFFAAIRALHNARATRPELARLSFVLLGVATPTELIKDATRTPFNIGQRVELGDFGVEQISRLVKGLAPADAVAVAQAIRRWTHGQPYLTMRLCKELAARPEAAADVDALATRVLLAPQVRGDPHFQFISHYLAATPAEHKRQVFEIAERCIEGRKVRTLDASPPQVRLRLSGLLRDENGQLVLRNEVYRRLFDGAWLRSNRPTFWTERNIRVALIAAAGVFALLAVLLGFTAWRAFDLQALESEAKMTERRARDEAVAARTSAEEQRVRADLNAERLRSQADVLRQKNQELSQANRYSLLEAERSRKLAARNRELAQKSHAWRLASEAAAALASRRQRSAAADQQLALVVLAAIRLSGDDGRQAAPAALRAFSAAQPPWTSLPAGDAKVLAATPDGQRVLTGHTDGKVRLIQVDSGRVLAAPSMHPAAAVTAIALSANGAVAASGGSDGSIRLWDPVQALPAGAGKLEGPQRAINALVLTPNGDALIAGDAGGGLWMWRLPDGVTIAAVPQAHSRSIEVLALGAEGRLLASGGNDSLGRTPIVLWEVGDGLKRLRQLDGHTDTVTGLAFTADGRTVISASDDDTLRRWDVQTGRPLGDPVPGAVGLNRRLLVGAAGTVAYTADELSGLLNWDLQAPAAPVGAALEARVRRGDKAEALAQMGSGPLLATLSEGVPVLYSTDTKTREPRRERDLSDRISHGGARVSAVAVNPVAEFKEYVSADTRGNLIRWETSSGQALGPPRKVGESRIEAIAWRPDGTWLATLDAEDWVRQWPRQDGMPPVPGPAFQVPGALKLAYSDDGEWLAVAGSRGVRVYAARSGRLERELGGADVRALAWLPKGRELFVAVRSVKADAGSEFELWRWDALGGRTRFRRTVSGNTIFDIAVDPGARLLALAEGGVCRDGGCRILMLDAATGNEAMQPLIGHSNFVSAVGFDPRGLSAAPYLASASEDGSVRFWSARDGSSLGLFASGQETQSRLGYQSLQYAPDGSYVIAGNSRGVDPWLAPDAWVPALCRFVQRNMTAQEWNQWVGRGFEYVRQCDDKP